MAARDFVGFVPVAHERQTTTIASGRRPASRHGVDCEDACGASASVSAIVAQLVPAAEIH